MLGDGGGEEGGEDVKVGLTFVCFFAFFPFCLFRLFYTELNRKSRENIGAVRKAADSVSNRAGRFPSM